MNTIAIPNWNSFGVTLCTKKEDLNNETITSHSNIVLIQKGQIVFNFPENENRTVEEGEIFFLSRGGKCTYSLLPNTKALILHIKNLQTLYLRFFPSKSRPTEERDNLFYNTLPITSLIDQWINSVEEYILNDKCNESLIEIKTKELLCLFDWCYSPGEIEAFWGPLTVVRE